MLNRDNPVQGVATYLEYQGAYGRLQYIITPHGFSEDGALLKPYALHRFLTDPSSKARWKREILGVEPNPNEEKDPLLLKTLEDTYLKNLFKRVVYGSWELIGKPLFVEVSKKDLTALRQGKTPTMLMSRLEKVRAVAEFPGGDN